MFNKEQEFAGRIYCPDKILAALQKYFGVETTEDVFLEAYRLYRGSILSSLSQEEIDADVRSHLESSRESGKLRIYIISAYKTHGIY